MRAKLFLAVGLAAFLLSSTDGLTQSGGGDSRGSPVRSGGPRGSSGGRSFGNEDPNEFFNRMANGKEVWSRAETDPRMLRSFDRVADRIGVTNGQITRQQYLTYSEQRAAERLNRGGPGIPFSVSPTPSGGSSPSSDTRGNSVPGGNPDSAAEAMFLRLDANGDGYLNYDEMPDELRRERERWDTDRNGLIDLTEFKAYFKARVQSSLTDPAGPGQQLPQAGSGSQTPVWEPGAWDAAPAPVVEEERKPPVVYRPGKLPKELPSWFAELDTDQDAQIGLYEWKVSGRSLREFEQIDRNKDGFLTVEEVLWYVAKEKERPGQSADGQQVSGGGNGPGRDRGRGGLSSGTRSRDGNSDGRNFGPRNGGEGQRTRGNRDR